MSEKKDNKWLKILTGILALALVILAAFTVNFYNEGQERETVLKNEKTALQEEMEELLVNYEKAIEENSQNKEMLQEARERIQILLDSVKGMNADLVSLNKFRRQVSQLQKEKEQLFNVIDSMKRKNERLVQRIDSTNVILEEQTIKNDSLFVQNKNLEEKITKGSKINIINLTAETFKVRNSGKTVSTDNAGRIDRINVCFTVLKNPLTAVGEKEFFIQVIDPKNNLVGTPKVENYGDDVLNYSTISKVYYENDNIKVCSAIDTEELEEGNYLVNVFHGSELLDTYSFILD